LRLIRAFPNLCQFGNEWSVNMPRIALWTLPGWD
jgi:hypothetical protein